MRTKQQVTVSRRDDHTDSLLPELTGLQFLVLTAVVREGEIAGRDLRAWLKANGVKSSGPQFYQLMARMEDARYVEGGYYQKEIEHQVVNERRYRLLERGRAAWEQTSDFYFKLRQGATATRKQRKRPQLV